MKERKSITGKIAYLSSSKKNESCSGAEIRTKFIRRKQYLICINCNPCTATFIDIELLKHSRP